MPFDNPLVAGEELIRAAIRSKNYQQGVSGWRIDREGGSEFENVVSRDTVTAPHVQASQSLSLQGIDLVEYLDNLPKGIIAWGEKSQGEENWGPAGGGTAQVGPVALITLNAKAGRNYKFSVVGQELITTLAGETANIWFHYTTNGTTPTSASPYMTGGRLSYAYSKRNNSNSGAVEAHFWSATDVVVKVGLFLQVVGAATSQVITWAGLNKWAFYCEDIGKRDSLNFGVTFNTPGVINPPPTNYDTTWWWTSVQSYQSSGAPSIATGNNVRGYQGNGSGVGNPGGNHWGMFFFDSANIRANLAGATITESYIYLDNLHCYLNSGVQCLIGWHNHDPTPGTLGGSRLDNQWNIQMAKGGDGWTGNLGAGLGNGFRDAAIRGIMVGVGGSDLNHYGYFDRCAVRFKYSK